MTLVCVEMSSQRDLSDLSPISSNFLKVLLTQFYF